MLLGARSTPFSVGEIPCSPPFSKKNGGELTLGTVAERSRESASRRTLAVPRLSARCGKHPQHSYPISDFLRASRPEARLPQPGALDRSTVAIPPLGTACLRWGRLSSGTSLRTWRSPSHA